MSVRLPDVDLRKISIATCSFAASSLLVNTVAFIGQYGYASEHFGWDKPGDILYAATIESIAVTVAAHAHQSQKNNDSALRTKLASYALGAVVGALNYSHFSVHWHPTAKAVSLGLLSALSPWLWSMFSRRVSRDLFMERGLLEGRAVKLGATRWFWHPLGSFRAMRWATWIGEQNPSAAIVAVGTRTGNQNRPDAGVVPEPVAVPAMPLRELEPALVPEPASDRNQNRNGAGSGSGTEAPAMPEPELEPGRIPEPEPAQPPLSEPEPVADQNPELGTGESAEPAARRRGPARGPRDVALELKPRAEEVVATWLAVHGRRPTAAQLAKELGKSKAVACEALKLTQWLTQAPAAEVAV
jgi:hypothetical protein